MVDDSTGLPMQTAPLKHGEYYVPTIYNDINHSSPWLQDFLDNELSMGRFADDQFERKGDTATAKFFYIKRFLPLELNEDDFKLYLEYMLFSFKGRYYVTKLEIWGDLETVADVFFGYYPFAEKKVHGFYSLPKIIKRNPDQITISKEIVKGKEIGNIVVVPFNNMSWEEYSQMVEPK